MNIEPIKSWKEYVYAVKQMRNYQSLYFKLRSQMTLGLAKAWEAAVDEVTGRKFAELYGTEQNEKESQFLPLQEDK